jgi:hypothetical protein
MLCSIECNRSRPIADDPSSTSFRDDVRGWAKITKNVFVWDYVIQFSNLVSPFPNFRVLQPNVRFFAENHARGMFAQGNREVRGELAELRSYVLAKLLWNPESDVQKLIDEFLRGYYGPAASAIGDYLALVHDELGKRTVIVSLLLGDYLVLVHDELEASGAGLSIFGSPGDARNGYLAESKLERYKAIFDRAESLAAPDPVLLARVLVARMPLQYAQLELRYGTKAERRTVADRLFRTARACGLKQFTEWNLSVAEYRKKLDEGFAKEK